ncbi:hypothetical protein Tco_0879291 [Tanacetum coccineum]
MQLLHSCFDWNDYVCVLSGSQDASMLHNQIDCMKEQGYLEDLNTEDHLNAKERKQDKCPLETPLDFEEGVFDDEVQQNEAIPLSDEEIALDASSEDTMSLGGNPRYEYNAEADEAEDDY